MLPVAIIEGGFMASRSSGEKRQIDVALIKWLQET